MYTKYFFQEKTFFVQELKKLRKGNRDFPTSNDLYKVMNYRLSTSDSKTPTNKLYKLIESLPVWKGYPFTDSERYDPYGEYTGYTWANAKFMKYSESLREFFEKKRLIMKTFVPKKQQGLIEQIFDVTIMFIEFTIFSSRSSENGKYFYWTLLDSYFDKKNLKKIVKEARAFERELRSVSFEDNSDSGSWDPLRPFFRPIYRNWQMSKHRP
jgi:hypothetical protein